MTCIYTIGEASIKLGWPTHYRSNIYTHTVFMRPPRVVRPTFDLRTMLSHGFTHTSCLSGFSSSIPSDISNQGLTTNPHGLAEEKVVVLVIGGGAREHSLCYALRKSPTCQSVLCAPGNAGISRTEDAICFPDLDISNSSAVASFCHEIGVGLVVVGPEAPLVSGLVNALVRSGIPTFGPSAEAAALEGSKKFMKSLCDKYQIPTAKYRVFTDPHAAKAYIRAHGVPIVVKADGLASGKGVVVAQTVSEADQAVDSMLIEGVFGAAGCRILIEEFMEGEEVSLFALTDGVNVVAMEPAQDHKRVGHGETGPNTGGMGAYSPTPLFPLDLQRSAMDSIILPTVRAMAAEGRRFIGLLYAGIMVENGSRIPKLLEYNVRFGDPECQALMVRLRSDLCRVLMAACMGQLGGARLEWDTDASVAVVMASKGYPGGFEEGSIVRRVKEAERAAPFVKIFYGRTGTGSGGELVATGGRVLTVTGKGRDVAEARDRAYRAVDAVDWAGGFCRRDIGWRVLSMDNK